LTRRPRILCIMAHPDDAELWCGGTLTKSTSRATCSILVESTDQIRANEAKLGAKILGAEIYIAPALTPDVCEAQLRRLKPEVVITHPPGDVHPDHRRVSTAVLAAIPAVVIDTGFPKRLYSCDTYNSLLLSGSVTGTRIIDVSAAFETKLAALGCHTTQPLEHFLAMATRQGAWWGARIGCEHAEAFDPIPLLGCLPKHDWL